MPRTTLRRTLALLLVGSGLVMAGCTTPGIVRLSEDTYRVSRADSGHVFADAEAMKAAAAADADAFARSRGMVAVPIGVVSDTLAVGHLSTLDYDFRLVPPGTPTPPAATPAVVAAPRAMAPATSAAPAQVPLAPHAVASGTAPIAAAQAEAPAAARRDYVDELIRLDDLRKRGILTDDEFQTLKAKILSER